MYCVLFIFFFFFQAEDGIRDGTVSGVQTCALPILIEAEVTAIVDDATDKALAAEQPGPETVYDHVFSHDVDPTSEQFDTEDDPHFSGNDTTMVDLLNACMKDEMRRDDRIVMFGEDVADVSREEHADKVKGKG